MKNIEAFVQNLLDTALREGIAAAEAAYFESEAFSVRAMEGSVDSYEVSDTAGLTLRGTVDGRMGYASTEAFDPDAVSQLIAGVRESAALNEAEDQEEIFAGEASYPDIQPEENDLADVSAEEKIRQALALEKLVLAGDPRIAKTEGATVSTRRSSMLLQNSFGLRLSRADSLYVAHVAAVAKDGEAASTGGHLSYGRVWSGLDVEALAARAVQEAVGQLHAEPVPSGTYRVIMRNDAMQQLLRTFSGVFSAENAQQRLSLLGGREGTQIAAPAVTLVDDPLLRGGLATSAFDDEGSACRTKTVIESGTLRTLLHNRRTARKAGTQTTGNARRSGGIHVAPTNLFFRPGTQDLSALLSAMGEGLLITDISGMHAGANPISGDFSLLSKGFMIRGGQPAEPVERVTIAGNFYTLLQNIRALGSDLWFPGSSIGSPSVDVGELSVAGK